MRKRILYKGRMRLVEFIDEGNEPIEETDWDDDSEPDTDTESESDGSLFD